MRNSTIYFDKTYINSFYSCVGKLESEGPLGKYFDAKNDDGYFGEDSWEKAESRMVKNTVSGVMTKNKSTPDDIDMIFGGDLLNQCVGSSFGLKEYGIPFFGLYGACSTFVEAVGISSAMLSSGFSGKNIATASSHFCSSEKQYRFPLEYGGVRTPTAQWTVTGCGAVVMSREKSPIKVSSMTIGSMKEKGVCDANNMGAAMAPAAADTIYRHFSCGKENIDDYDFIVTGDLADVGSELLIELLKQDGMDISEKHIDCGSLIFNNPVQGTNAGGSGCGCIASVFCAYFAPKFVANEIKKALFVGTGALMSPTTALLGEPIVGIAHGVTIENEV